MVLYCSLVFCPQGVQAQIQVHVGLTFDEQQQNPDIVGQNVEEQPNTL